MTLEMSHLVRNSDRAVAVSDFPLPDSPEIVIVDLV